LRPAFWGLPRASWSGAGPHLSALSSRGETRCLALRRASRVCLAFLLSCHPRTPGNAGVYRPSPPALPSPDDSESGGRGRLADRIPHPETPRPPHHALCRGAAGVRTLPVAGHGYRQRAHGPAGAARQRPARAVRHAVPETPAVAPALLAAGATTPLALSRPSPATPHPDPPPL